VAETWRFDDDPVTLTADAAIDRLRARIASEKLESWLASSAGRLLAVVTNKKRAIAKPASVPARDRASRRSPASYVRSSNTFWMSSTAGSAVKDRQPFGAVLADPRQQGLRGDGVKLVDPWRDGTSTQA
jgi:hypothetical protein